MLRQLCRIYYQNCYSEHVCEVCKKEIDHGTKLKGIHILMEALNSGETGNNEGFLMRNFLGPKTE